MNRRELLKGTGALALYKLASSRSVARAEGLLTEAAGIEMLRGMDIHVIAIHGWMGDGSSGLLLPLKNGLDSVGISNSFPNVGSEERPNAEEWIQSTQHEIRIAQKPVVLVPYSAGNKVADDSVNEIPDDEPSNIFARVSIAPFSPFRDFENAQRRDRAYAGLFEREPINPQKQIDRIPNRYVIYSESDPQIPHYQSLEAAGAYQAYVKNYPTRGHFREPTDADVVFDALLDLRRKQLLNI